MNQTGLNESFGQGRRHFAGAEKTDGELRSHGRFVPGHNGKRKGKEGRWPRMLRFTDKVAADVRRRNTDRRILRKTVTTLKRTVSSGSPNRSTNAETTDCPSSTNV